MRTRQQLPVWCLMSAGLLSSAALAQDPSRSRESELRTLMTWIRTRTYDAIPAIDHPEFASADSGSLFLRDSDQVIGVRVGRHAKAYPVEFLNGRELVNDSLGGRPLTVTW